jgi:hypothetical protein
LLWASTHASTAMPVCVRRTIAAPHSEGSANSVHACERSRSACDK